MRRTTCTPPRNSLISLTLRKITNFCIGNLICEQYRFVDGHELTFLKSDERTKLDFATVIVWIKISVVFYLLTILSIVDIVRKDFGTIGKKALWGIIAMIPFVGWLIYLIFGFRKGKKPVHEDQ